MAMTTDCLARYEEEWQRTLERERIRRMSQAVGANPYPSGFNPPPLSPSKTYGERIPLHDELLLLL